MNYNDTFSSSQGAFSCESEGRRSASEAPLVTNTESKTTFEKYDSLYVPCPKALERFSSTSKRYFLQSINKDMLGNSYKNDDGTKSKFYRFMACKSLSASFRPSGSKVSYDDYEHLNRWSDEISIAKLSYRYDDNENMRASMTGMCRCDSVWICPVCQPSIAEYRAAEIRKALYDHKKSGKSVLFVTFTLSHTKKTALVESMNALTKSVAKTKQSKNWTLFKKRTGFLGSIRTLEHTYTEKNGHHPHLHELWFFDSSVSAKETKKWVYERYSSQLAKFGFKASLARGVDVLECLTTSEQSDLLKGVNLTQAEAIAAYWAKGLNVDQTFTEFSESGEWGVAEELTKHHLKGSRKLYSDGTPVVSYNAVSIALKYYELSYRISVSSDNDELKLLKRRLKFFKGLFCDYANVTKGRSQLFWSRGLKDHFGIYEFSDENVGDSFDDLSIDLMHLSVEDLQRIIKYRLRPCLISIIEDPCNDTDEKRVSSVKSFLSSSSYRSQRFG